MDIYTRVRKAKEYLDGLERYTSMHQFIKDMSDCEFDDKQAIFNVILSSRLFEYEGFKMANTRTIINNWRNSVFFHIPLLDDNFKEETGVFHINIYMKEQCCFESYLTWAKYPLNNFDITIK